MNHTNGGDASQPRIEELQRHIRVLESCGDREDPAYGAIQDTLDDLEQRATKPFDACEQWRGVMTDGLTKLNELVEAQNRTASNFALLLAGLRLAPAPAPPPPPAPRREVVKPKRKASRLHGRN